MRKSTFSSKLFAAFFINVLLCFYVAAEGITISDSLKDDVAAMITSAKKMPHQIFIVDSSDSMNSFAYSDYIDTCRDGEANLEKALALCNNAYQQCRNVENNAMCSVDLNCGDVSTKCSQIDDVKTKLHTHCTTIFEITYKEPDRYTTVSTGSNDAKKYVGPWNPGKTYKEDLCFYDWTADTHADVLEGTSSADRYNKEKLGMTDEEFDSLKESSGGFIADRSDWDCLTDGSDNMTDGKSLQNNPVSGHWLNWKYTTSLDALKIILGNVHSFSVQPRTRGENRCHRTTYKPKGTYNEQRLDEDGNPLMTDEGLPIIDEKNICFIAFDPSRSDVSGEARRKELESIRTAIDSLWESKLETPSGGDSANDPEDTNAFKATKCEQFDIVNIGEEGFSLYTKEEYVCGIDDSSSGCDSGTSYDALTTTASSSCDKCMIWKSNPDGTGSFVATKCTSYSGSTTNPDAATLASFSFNMKKQCCKATECANPHCRDNDLNCKTNQGTIGGNLIGYCSSLEETCGYQGKPNDDPSCCNPNYKCILDHYSEFDQDMNHCCQELKCAEEGTTTTYTDLNGNLCDSCKSGSVLGKDSESQESDTVTILPDPGDDVYCGYDSGSDTCTGIGVTVSVDGSIDYTPLDSVKVTVYYGCVGETGKPSVMLGTATCNASGCPSISGTLNGCGDKGYRMRATVTVTRNGCKLGNANTSFSLKYFFDDGYKKQNVTAKTIFDPDQELYQMFVYQTSSNAKKVFEYECKASFYNREVAVIKGSSCPSASEAPEYLNENREGAPVEYCEARTAEREVIDRDEWFNPIKVACSWLCRSAEVYDDPWKCQSFFYMTDAAEFNGIGSAGSNCTLDSVDKIEDCCRCINSEQGLYYHHQTPTGVDMSTRVTEPVSGSGLPSNCRPCTGQHCVCAVSIYQFATASDGTRTESSGYQAEIVNGHINEGTTPGYYNLVPYKTFADTNSDSPYDGWYREYSLLYSQNGARYLRDSMTSLFTTNDSAVRTPTCVYDVLWGWTGTDCDTSCTSGCCSIDLSQDSNDCDYPMFWMKIPKGEGGRLLMGASNLTQVSSIDEFRRQLKALKAIGGSTLGETLYDAWRYLGGMYALHDPNYKNTPYTSPYGGGSSAECNTNEAIIISGGQPQFDHNDKLQGMGTGTDTIDCKKFSATAADSENPCVKPVDTQPNQLAPYETKDWYNSSLLNVAAFVNSQNHSFWGTDACRALPVSQNAKGCDPAEVHLTGANIPRIDRVHSIAIGEWGLSAMYDTLKSTGTGGSTGSFMDASFMERVATQTKGFDNVKGKYFGLTASTTASGTEDGGTFNNLTELFASFASKSRDSDVVVGRPHWTSSLVQPYDVEEKYRGPNAYVAGAVPVDGSVSRFWFGNLKKYNVDGGTDCPITDDADANCGEWKKQTFDSGDCFSGDGGSDFSGDDDDSVEQYRKLMVGGAAHKLKNLIESSSCSTAGECYKTSGRTLYYDQNTKGAIFDLKTANLSSGYLYNKFVEADPSITETQIRQIIDYMAGYDSFDDDHDGDSTNVRYTTTKKTFTVDDPFNIDFNKATKLTLRPLLLGAIVHSKPVAVFYDNDTTTRIYAGANDGMLHAFDENGNEVYAYMPTLAIPSIANFKETESNIFFNATVDGPITLLHIDQSHDGIINGGEKAYLIFGYRRGARGYTVLDVSDKDEPKFVQNINTDGGYSFGKVMVFRKCEGTCSFANELKYYIAVPGGYDECHDPTALSSETNDNNITCSFSELNGNKFTIYELNTTKGKFEEAVAFNMDTPASKMTTFTKSWLVTSFTSVPFVVNTKGKAAVDTEYVYFNDLSGTVFRVDVTSSSVADWTAKVVYTERNGGTGESRKEVPWGITSKSYVSSNFFPPLERYNPTKKSVDETSSEDWLIPIPIVTGNAANPRYTSLSNAEFMTVFYDKKGGAYDEFDSDTVYEGKYLGNDGGNAHTTQNQIIEDKHGWRVVFNREDGEKGITEPLVVYDIYGGKSEDSNSYTIAWNTFTPMKLTECRSFGTSSNYERYVLDGNQHFTDTSMTGSNGEWTVSADTDNKCLTDPSKAKNISLATGVGIIASDSGYDLTFGAGADIFRKEILTVKDNKTYIIKWYELY